MCAERINARLSDLDVVHLDVVHSHLLASTPWANRSDALRWALHHASRCLTKGQRAGDGQCCALMAPGPAIGSNPTPAESAAARERVKAAEERRGAYR